MTDVLDHTLVRTRGPEPEPCARCPGTPAPRSAASIWLGHSPTSRSSRRRRCASGGSCSSVASTSTTPADRFRPPVRRADLRPSARRHPAGRLPRDLHRRPGAVTQQLGIAGEKRELKRRYSYTSGWHTDVTPAVNPPAASILRADECPSTAATRRSPTSSPPTRDCPNRCGGSPTSCAPSTTTAPRRPAGHQEHGRLYGRIDENRLVAHHPVVRVIPETGERALFVNPVFTGADRRRQPRREPPPARAVLRPDHAAGVHGAVPVGPSSVAFWDNRATSHLGPQDLDDLDVARALHRVTLIGEVPVGPDGRESELVEGEPFVGISATCTRDELIVRYGRALLAAVRGDAARAGHVSGRRRG